MRSEKWQGFGAGSFRRIWRRASRRSAQPQRRAALPEEADRDVVSLHHASQSHRLQVETTDSGQEADSEQTWTLILLSSLRSLALLLREVMAGSVLLPTMDFMADPVSRADFWLVDCKRKLADIKIEKELRKKSCLRIRTHRAGGLVGVEPRVVLGGRLPYNS